MTGPFENIDLGLSGGGVSIKDLEEDLDVALSAIAFDRSAKDLNYIQRKVGEMKSDYDSLVKGLGSADNWISIGSGLGLAVGSVIRAYDGFVCEDWKEMGYRERAQVAENLLGDNFFLSRPAV